MLLKQVAGSAASVAAPTGAAFDIVLLLHIGCVLVGFTSLLVTGAQAWRARAGPDGAGNESVTRYFRPGVNWPGRTLYGVLLFGFVLVAMSRGTYDLGEAFVQLGLVLWIVCVALAELVVWPAERELQRLVSGEWRATEAQGLGARVAVSAWVVSAVIVVATVIMVQKP